MIAVFPSQESNTDYLTFGYVSRGHLDTGGTNKVIAQGSLFFKEVFSVNNKCGQGYVLLPPLILHRDNGCQRCHSKSSGIGAGVLGWDAKQRVGVEIYFSVNASKNCLCGVYCLHPGMYQMLMHI